MKQGWQHHGVALVGLVVLGLLTLWGRWQLVALVPWLIAVPVFLAFTYRNSFWLLVVVWLLGELFSQLPPGVATALVLLPYVVSRPFWTVLRLWSLRLWLGVAVIVGLQLIVSLVGYVWGEGLLEGREIGALWMVMPWGRMAAQWLLTTALTAVLAGLWHEMRPSGGRYSVA